MQTRKWRLSNCKWAYKLTSQHIKTQTTTTNTKQQQQTKQNPQNNNKKQKSPNKKPKSKQHNPPTPNTYTFCVRNGFKNQGESPN